MDWQGKNVYEQVYRTSSCAIYSTYMATATGVKFKNSISDKHLFASLPHTYNESNLLFSSWFAFSVIYCRRMSETGVWDRKGQPKSLIESYELKLENLIRMTDHSNK